MIPDNAWILRITAAAGTELADPYSHSTVKLLHEVELQTSIRTEIEFKDSLPVTRWLPSVSTIVARV